MISATRQAIFHLSEEDRRELYDSGINDTTIGRYAPYTEHSAATISRLLNRHRPYDEDSNGALVYPVYDSNGQPYSDFVQVKLHVPRRSLDGKVIKYEIPAGRGYRIGFSPDTVRTHDLCTPLFIVEGIKKGMIVDQMGYGVAILLGIDCWSEPGIESRPLLPDFDAVPLEGRTVVVLFDTDSRRNPNVHRSRGLLAHRLAERGALIHIMELPSEKNDVGEFIKVGVDDYVVRHGAEAFQERLVKLIDPPPVVSLHDYRRCMAEANLLASREPGIKRCAAPTGAGKSYSTIHTLRHNHVPALIVQPTHRQNAELVALCEQNGMARQIASYPQLSGRNCRNSTEVKRSVQYGINRRLICVTCPYQTTCSIRHFTQRAAIAPISVGTHARFQYSHSMRNKKKHIHVHENISTLLAPTMPLTGDFRALQSVFEAARNRYNNNSAACLFIDSLLQITQSGIAYHAVNETTVFACPVVSRRNWPDGVWEELCREIMTGSIQDQIGNTLRFCQYVLRRRVRRVVVHCDRFRENMRRTISVHLKSEIPRRSANKSYILYDASLSHDTAEKLLGGPIVDITPPGRLQPLHRIVQYPDADIKIGTAPSRVRKILQSLLFLRYPEARRIGIICHKIHRDCLQSFIDGLPSDQRDRIVIVEHFRGSISRGSNRFQEERLDTIFVLGTPRVSKSVIRDRVVQCNDFPALDSEYGPDHWIGFTEIGQIRLVHCSDYRNHDWHAAMSEIVGSELVQAVGRGRIYLEDGVPLVVLASNFNTGLGRDEGLYLADDKLPKMTNMALRDLNRIVDALFCPPNEHNGVAAASNPTLRATFSNNIIERFLLLAGGADREGEIPAFSRLSSNALADRCSINRSTMVNKLRILVSLGLVTKIGQRGGYTITHENWQKIVLVYRSAHNETPASITACTLPLACSEV